MSQTLPPGPYKTLSVDGLTVPWYIIPFDKDGACTGPQTREHMLASLASGGFTDVFLFSHGWNNDWSAASKRYDEFFESYAGLRAADRLDYGREYKPLFAGIFWPSTALVLPFEESPDFAGANDLDSQVAGELQEIEELAAAIPAASRARFYALMQQGKSLSAEDEEELAQLLAPLWNDFQRAGTDDADVPVEPITAAELAALWRSDRAAQADDADEYGGLVAGSPLAATLPAAALSLGDVVNAPRNLVRLFTVLQMKDRAVRVGGSGVASLLSEVLQQSQARVHLIGHSYGCIITLSALSAIPENAFTRKVGSVLLLQAAVSRFCFAYRVPGKTYAGGYRIAFNRVEQPILSTFSRRDGPLTKVFHVAVRRDSDLGQPAIAGARVAPSKYAALGGYGPDGCRDGEQIVETIHAVGEPYDLRRPDVRVIALQADDAIKSHGAVSVRETWWALYNQVRGV